MGENRTQAADAAILAEQLAYYRARAAEYDEFWTKVRSALAAGGSAYVIDSGWDTTSSATNHARPERERGIAVRKLNDGREYRVVKVFHDPAKLTGRLAALGLASRVVRTPRYFIHGAVTRLQGGSP